MNSRLQQNESGSLKLAVAVSASHSDPIKGGTISWSYLIESLTRVTVGAKEGKGWVAAHIPDGSRTNNRVVTTSLLVFDIDNKTHTMTQTSLEKVVRDNGYKAILHSTHSHTPEHPRFRLILAISEPIKPSDHKSVLLQVAQNLGISDFIDKACTDPSRYFYLPRCPEESVDDYVFWSTDGQPVNVEDCLDSIKCAPESTTALSLIKPEHNSEEWQENEHTIAKVREFLSYCPADCDYEVWRSIVWSVCSLNWQSGKTLVEEWSRISSRHWPES